MEPVPNAEQFDLFERLRSEEIEWAQKAIRKYAKI
jgi:hypothetical protein